MLIDWFTLSAQALNFLILVWLMKRFLYKPILQAIDTREKLIATELSDAEAKKTEAKKDRDEFQHKNEIFDQERAALLSKATEEAKTERQRLLDEARKAADILSVKRHETLNNEAHDLSQAISLSTQKEVFAIAQKMLKDLASASLEKLLVEVLVRRLREMNPEAKEVFAKALKTTADPVRVQSAFDLPAEERLAIQNALNQTFSVDTHLQFETSPDFICGIELTVNGQKMSWSITDYLSTLEKEVAELLKGSSKQEVEGERQKTNERPA